VVDDDAAVRRDRDLHLLLGEITDANLHEAREAGDARDDVVTTICTKHLRILLPYLLNYQMK
jgi:hypothetical protein